MSALPDWIYQGDAPKRRADPAQCTTGTARKSMPAGDLSFDLRSTRGAEQQPIGDSTEPNTRSVRHWLDRDTTGTGHDIPVRTIVRYV